MLKVVEKRKIWFTISIIIIVIGIGFMCYRGLNFGIDFRGGTLMQININKDFNKQDTDKIIEKYVKSNEFESTKANNKELTIRINSEAISDANTTKLFNDIKDKYKLKDSDLISRDRIGATIGNDLVRNAVTALSISIILMLFFIAYRFEFKFGLAAIIALLHDVLITLSVYAIGNLQINTPFIAAILTIIGYSIADTIVIFDRIRENQKKLRGKELIEIADTSISQTVGRSICTVTTTVVTITCLHIFVPGVREFTIPILVGIISGCYSSIFIASPIWYLFKKRSSDKKRTDKKELIK
ncbi:protein translocase subunit SecF [Clostridium pasteurianum]|uniref:Protein-export membrane protein SecF n=1 Tax=Clostridium pasteurianum BC1 TaxID=86416 RepID=R4K3N6_CLOPA|nr:protein translocase subunit SecF [Clostridium pasteurianum]AGK97193.1 protein-export membrane protein SecF [Clostridium pasteurianum BC1]